MTFGVSYPSICQTPSQVRYKIFPSVLGGWKGVNGAGMIFQTFKAMFPNS